MEMLRRDGVLDKGRESRVTEREIEIEIEI